MNKIDRMTTIFNSMRKSNENLDFESFKAGYNAALAELDRQKQIKTDRKNKKLIVEDFLRTDSDFVTNRYFMSGVYHEDGKQVVTDGRYLLVHRADYDKEIEGKIIKDGKEIEGRYPLYERVIPEDSKLVEDSTLNVDVVKSISSASKTKSINKQYEQIVKIVSGDKTLVMFPMAIIKKLEKFLDCYPSAVIMRHSDDTDNERCRAWKAVDKTTGDIFVFMPVNNDSKYTHSYDIVSNVVTEL